MTEEWKMSKYIDKDLLKSELMSHSESERMAYMGVFDVINCMPEADVVEVKHGKWAYAYMNDVKYYRCTECDEYVEATCFGAGEYKYCPYCGARMEDDFCSKGVGYVKHKKLKEMTEQNNG